MANNETLIPIPGRLHSVATEGHVAGADEIYDDDLQMNQAEINAIVIGRLDALEAKVAHYHPDGVSINTNKQTVYVNRATTVDVTVAVIMRAESIKLYRGETLIQEATNSDGFTYQDPVNAPTAGTISYHVEATIGGVDYEASVNVSAVADSITGITWTDGSISPASVEVGHTATLDKGTVMAVYASGTTERVTDSAAFSAQRGTINGTTYTAPNTDGNDTISVTYGGKTASNTLSVTVELGIKDYYVGWATGDNASFDGFADLSDVQIAALANGYSKVSTPSITKTVTAAEATGTRQVFFLMWKQGSAPVSGSVTSGGITENLSVADFVDTSVFRATHNDVTIDNTTYHVAGMRGAFDAGDIFVVNF